MRKFFVSYRRIYPWVFAAVILGEFLCFGSGLHKVTSTYFINSLKIITSGITILAFTVSLVEVAMNRSISKLAEKSAKDAVLAVEESIKAVNNARADFRLEIIRNCLERNEYRRCNDQIKEVRRVIKSYQVRDKNDPVVLLLGKIDTFQTKLSVAVQNGTELDADQLEIFFDLLTKLDNFINDKLNA